MNIWQNLKRPIFIQAPMEDVADTVFRQIIASVGKPDLFFTEFTNADGIIKADSEYVSQRLKFNKKIEHPIIAQIWGNNPENYFRAGKILLKMGFDGIDINMGCPDRKVVKNGCCSALIKNHTLAKKLFEAAHEGAPKLPISVKTRVGFSNIQTEEWISFLLSLNPAAITIHARTVKEMSKVPAHWEEIKKAVKLRNKLKSNTLIIGNGDIESYKQSLEYAKRYGCDGIMIGRGMLHNPWIFNPNVDFSKITISEKLNLLKKHIKLFHKTWGDKKNFDLMKKFYKAYINGFENAATVRAKLFSLKNSDQTVKKIESIISNLPPQDI